MSIAHVNRKTLEQRGDYPIKVNKAWFAVFPDKLDRLAQATSSKTHEDVSLVLYRTESNNERDHFAIPFSFVSDLFQRDYLTHSKVNGSIRWNCTMKEGILHVSHSGVERDVTSYFGALLPFEITDLNIPEEVEDSKTYVEGRVISIRVNRYERDSTARNRCIEALGSRCIVCDFSFAEVYGDTMGDFIHVHHLHPLHLADGERIINPETDLVPICPNCHAVIHTRNPPLSIEETKRMIQRIK